jgi:prepilin-type N-terminal cleavage/methylation domain-containing protein
MRKHAAQSSERRGFTLIELMVVVALVGILIGGVFKLMGTVNRANKRATTVQRLQRLENAIAGYYSEYGSYPPVQRHESPDPFKHLDASTGNYGNAPVLDAEDANRAARSQPVTFAFPCREDEDAALLIWFETHGMPGVLSANASISAFNSNSADWQDVKVFRLGLLSFLLPRLRMMAEFDQDGTMVSGPNPALFDLQQWKANNLARQNDYRAQLARESAACARWLPNLAHIIVGFYDKAVMGVELGGGGDAPYARYQGGGGVGFRGLKNLTVHDGWDREFYYYSPPPYQSYRLWSAGPDGKTFPAGYPLESLKEKENGKEKALKTISGWTKDDIVGFDK